MPADPRRRRRRLLRLRLSALARLTRVNPRGRARALDGTIGRCDVTLVIDGEAPIVVPSMVTAERAIALATRLRVPFESWDDGRLKERRDAAGRLVMEPPTLEAG